MYLFIVYYIPVTLTNIGLNNNVMNNDLNINKNKDEELEVSLSTDSDGEANKEHDCDVFMKKASDKPMFKATELLNGRLKWYFESYNVFNSSHRKLSRVEVSLLSKV